jgi:hypothetical protein
LLIYNVTEKFNIKSNTYNLEQSKATL